MNHCKQCHSEIQANASLCFSCGSVQNVSDAVECEHHAGEPAVGVCVLCGKPVCGDCTVSVDGKIFCENTAHQALFRQWSIVHESGFEFESDMIQRNIAAADIETMIFSFRSYLGTKWLAERKPVRVLVPREQLTQAIDLLRDLRLLKEQEGDNHERHGDNE